MEHRAQCVYAYEEEKQHSRESPYMTTPDCFKMDSRPPTPFPFMAMPDELIPECPICGCIGTFKTHAEHGVNKCPTCEDKVCSECYWGCRYMCPVALPKPQHQEKKDEQIQLSPKKEMCVCCKSLDIRYSQYTRTYELHGGFLCSDCASAISGF